MAVGNVAFGLNLFTLAIDILTWLINMSALIVLVQHVYTKRLRCKKKVIFWIYMYIHLTLLVLMSSLMFFHVETYLGDGYNNNIQSVACTFVGFMLYIALNMFVLSLVNQVIVRQNLISTYWNHFHLRHCIVYVELFIQLDDFFLVFDFIWFYL